MCPVEPVRSASDTQFLQSWHFILNKWYKQNFLDSFFLKELKKVEEIPDLVGLLPHVSKIFERLIYKQINSYTYDKISKSITSFRKCHATQYSLLVMLEKWKKTLDKLENVCTIFMGLSKAFDTINHNLLLAKLKVYGFSENALTLMCSYLKDQRQAVQVKNNFSS